MGNTIWSPQEEAHLLSKAREFKLAKISTIKGNEGTPYLPSDCAKVQELAEDISNKYGTNRKVGALITKYRDMMTLVGKVDGLTVDTITDSYIDKAVMDSECSILSLRLEHMQNSFEGIEPGSNYLMIDLIDFKKAWSNGKNNVWDCLHEATVCSD